MIEKTLEQWHAFMESHDPAQLDALLADNCVFHSPVVHTPQEGKELTKMYLTAAGGVFHNGTFSYAREVASGHDAVLEFTAELDGIFINGIDMIRCDDSGKIVDFKVMLRPLKAVNLMHQKMMAMLEQFKASS